MRPLAFGFYEVGACRDEGKFFPKQSAGSRRISAASRAAHAAAMSVSDIVLSDVGERYRFSGGVAPSSLSAARFDLSPQPHARDSSRTGTTRGVTAYIRLPALTCRDAPAYTLPVPGSSSRKALSKPRGWLVLACVVVVGLALAQVLLFSFGRDQSIYAQVASVVLEGGMPYRDAWDFKPPGIFLVYAIAEALLGKAMTSVRVVEAAGLLALVWAFVRFSATYFGSRLAGLVGGAIAVTLHAQLEFWHTAQPESFGGMVTALALVVTGAEPRTTRQRWAQWSLVGAWFGVAFLLKPPLGGGAIVCATYLARREQLRTGSVARALLPALVGAMASLSILGLVASWFVARGAWTDLAWTLFEFTPGYTQLSWDGASTLPRLYYATMELAWKFSAFPIAGALLALGMKPLHGREREGLSLVVGVMAIQLVGVVMQGKFFQYHYGATLQLAALVAGLGFTKLWLRAERFGPLALAGYAALVMVLGSLRTAVRDLTESFWARSSERLAYLVGASRAETRAQLDALLYHVADFSLGANRGVAQAIAEVTPEDASVFVWGFEPSIYWLSGRAQASRFIYNVPQRVSWDRELARRTLMKDLEPPPRVIVVQHGDVFSYVTGDSLDSHQALATFPELYALVRSRYDKLRSVEDFDLYVLRGDG